jgi:hypothetical protein
VLLALTRAPRRELVMVTSDQIARRADPCGGSSPHGYLGIETMVVQRISGWIRMADLREASFAQRTSRITPRQNLRSIRPPAGAPPKPPTPIRSWRRSPVTACQALLLETTSKGVSAGVKAVDRTRCLVFAAKFLGGDTGGQGQGQRANYPSELQPSTPIPEPFASVSLSARYGPGTS